MFTGPDKIADRIRLGYFTALVLILVSYFMTFYTTERLLNQAEMVNHTNKVISRLGELLYNIKEGDGSFRGYIITHDKSFLEPNKIAQKNTNVLVDTLRSFTVDNPSQQSRLDTLKTLIEKKFSIINMGIRFYDKSHLQNSDSILQIISDGNKVMENIKVQEVEMQVEENNLMKSRTNKFNSISNGITIINIISLALVILMIFYSVETFNKENKAKKDADESSASYRTQLQDRVDELYKLNTELLELRGMEKFAVTGRIARTIAHEVRNPLTNINLAAEQLKSEINPGDDTELLFDIVSRNSRRINQLISDLLNSTKADQLTFQKMSINKVLDESLEFAEDRIELKGIKIIKDYADDICPVLVDLEKIKIAFSNIIVNAIEAMKQDEGLLSITTENKEDKCVVTISDNGKGMEKSEVGKLFEPYFTTKEKGTGLGLTNTQNIVLSHNATVVAKSEPGSGTSFIITFSSAS